MKCWLDGIDPTAAVGLNQLLYRSYVMPKLKTNRGAAKRFRVTGSGKIKRKRAFHSHILTKKDTKRKRRLRSTVLVSKADEKSIRQMLPNL